MSTQDLRFGPHGRFELRRAEHRLLVDGQPATPGGRALDLLMALTEQPGALLTKAELIERVWPKLVVEEGNLRVQINALRRLLGEDAIATVPGRGYRFAAPVQAQSPAAALAPATASAPRLFGRDDELARLHEALRVPGCVTVAGISGIGKSSLARAAVARWSGRSAWVDLAPLGDAAAIPGALARALGGQLVDGDATAQLLRLVPPAEPLLLVLDNAEHLVEACAAWAAKLKAAPTLHLLVTSQLPLGVEDERVLRLGPLHVAGEGEPPDASGGALALLLARIAALDARFEATPRTLPLLAALCRQLDGLPLALEMAAARVPLMGLQAVHDALAERFALLSRGRRDSPARHRTLLAALDWSHGLLEPQEQRLFRALGVFAGGFTLELAVTLTSDEHVGRWDVVDGLATLVERSLVTVSGDDPPRYRLLETLRAYALQKLADTGDELQSLRRRHAAAVMALVAGQDTPAAWTPEMENVREAVAWAREHELATAATLVARAGRAMVFTPWRTELTAWMLAMRPAMEQADFDAVPAATQAAWWSKLAHLQGIRIVPDARVAGRRAVELWRPLGNPVELQIAAANWVRAYDAPHPELDEACALLREVSAGDDSPESRLRVAGALGVAARVRGDILATLACHEQEWRAARDLGMHAKAQAAENNVCVSLVRLGRCEEGVSRAQALLARIDADGRGDDNGNLPWVLNVIVEGLVVLGRLDEAMALAPRSLAAGRRFGTSVAWIGLLLLVGAQGRAEAGARLAGHARRLWTENDVSLDPMETRCIERAGEAALARFGADALAAWMAEGRAMPDEAAEILLLGRVDSN